MKRLNLLNTYVVGACLAGSCAGCASSDKVKPDIPPPLTSQQPGQNLTNLVAGILADPQKEGSLVTIVGYYRGWDLLGEANQPPPVTRGDWVIKDQSGALYVQANDVTIENRGKDPADVRLRGNDRESISHIMRVTGVVRLTRKSQAYIEPTRLEYLQ